MATDLNQLVVVTNTLPEKTKEPRTWPWSLLIGLAILGTIATIPAFGDASLLRMWTTIVMFIVLAQSWNFIGGYAGYAAFGNVAFFGIGSYSVGLLVLAGLPFWVGLIVGGVIAGVFALLIGLPVLRLRGHYFAIATLGTAEALREFVEVKDVGGSGGGLMSLPLPSLDAYPMLFYAFINLSVVCLLITVVLAHSRFGYALIAIRENEQAAEALGIHTYWYKVGAFVLSAVPTALAGGLYAYWATGFDPGTVFDRSISVEMVLLTFLGGTGTILGPIIGGILFETASFQFQTSGLDLHNTLLGLSIIVVTIILPQGLIRLLQEFTRKSTPGLTAAKRFMEGLQRVRRYITANGI
jgi:branched-chain amino acid transport system permease protein